MTPREDTESTEGSAESAPSGQRPRTRKRRRGGESGGGGATSPTEARDRAQVLAALESGIAEALPGVEILDRDLVFEDEGRADLAAVDPIGRLVLVLIAGEDTDGAVLDALDLVSYARRNTSLLVRHLASRRVDGGLAPRTVVIDPACDERLVSRLGSLGEAGVEVFGVRTLKSAAGERSYLIAAGAEAVPTQAGPAGVESFLDALPLPLQPVGRELADRLGRLDEDLLATGDERALVWRWNGEVLARMECGVDGLVASVAPHHHPAPVRGSDDVEEVLEEALGRLVVEFERGGARGAADEAEELAQRELVPEGPLLTDEEIQAFRDP